ncbi:MAG: glyoxalase [Cytophagales bacterium]|nr:glyoxalase [Cytophagales bacterium]
MTLIELNHAALPVTDLDRSIHFYGELLGLPRLVRPAFSFPGAWFALGQQELHLIARGRSLTTSTEADQHLALRVPDIQAVRQWLNERHIAHQPIKQRPDGAWQLFLQDPDGHWLEFTQIDSKP